MKDDSQTQVGRLALRVEGEMWNAYWAEPGTMDGAVFLGSLRMSLAHDARRKKAFMALMREAVNDLIKDTSGLKPIWGGPESAPEHERSGNA